MSSAASGKLLPAGSTPRRPKLQLHTAPEPNGSVSALGKPEGSGQTPRGGGRHARTPSLVPPAPGQRGGVPLAVQGQPLLRGGRPGNSTMLTRPLVSGGRPSPWRGCDVTPGLQNLLREGNWIRCCLPARLGRGITGPSHTCPWASPPRRLRVAWQLPTTNTAQPPSPALQATQGRSRPRRATSPGALWGQQATLPFGTLVLSGF